MGDLARTALALNPAGFAEQMGGWNEKDVWESLCKLMVLEAGVARERITKTARMWMVRESIEAGNQRYWAITHDNQ